MVLLPPIPLYRRILRAHRKHLSENMRLIGDNYVKSEFRSHRNIENPVHIVGRHFILLKRVYLDLIVIIYQVGFLTEWQMYAQKLEGGDWIREKMDPGKIEKMSGKMVDSRVFFFLACLSRDPYIYLIESIMK